MQSALCDSRAGRAGARSDLLVPALFGAGPVALFDRMHVAAGVLVQDDSTLFGQAWWVPLAFGLASVAATHVAGRVARRCQIDRTSTPAALAGTAILFALAYAASAALDATDAALTALVVLGLWLVGLASRRAFRGEMVLAVTAALIGPMIEAAFIRAGLFWYRRPFVLGFPLWLPALYLHAGSLAVCLAAWRLNDPRIRNRSARVMER